MLNLVTDVLGLSIGNAHDERLLSGVTCLLFDEPMVASVAVPGGAPAGRDLGCLEPDAAVEAVDAIVLSGGSGFGLDAASGVQAWLREQGRGFVVGPARVPVVPSAICFDLNNGGDKAWGRYPPYRELGHAAAAAARSGDFALGSQGAGFGATTVDLRGGLGSASATVSSGHVVGALVVVNALGSALMGDGPHFWAGPLERDREFGGLGQPSQSTAAMRTRRWKGDGRSAAAMLPPHPLTPATTIACVATDARLTKAEVKRMAIMASTGLARGLGVTFALMDGDTVFAVASGRGHGKAGPREQIEIGAAAADCLARAIARAVYHAANTVPGWLGPPSWGERFGLSVP